MKTIKKRTTSPLFSKPIIRNFSAVILAFIFLFSITSFISEKDNPSNMVLMPGVVFEIEVKDHEQSPPKTESMEAAVEGKNIKMDILPSNGENGKGKMIFRGNKGKYGEVLFVDDEKKEYYVMDDSFVDSILEKIDESKSMMDEALKGLTKEQRDMIEKMQKQEGAKIPVMMPPISKPKLTKTGQRGNKVGYPCIKYEVYLEGVRIKEIWTTDWSNIDGGYEARDAFGGMNNFFKQIKDKMGDMPGGNNFYDEMNFENGFPVVTKNFNEDTGELEDESFLRNSRRQTIDPDAFEPPSGYKRKVMFTD